MTPEDAAAVNADALIAAIGSRPLDLRLPGIDGQSVTRVIDFHREGWTGGKVVIIGAGQSGTEEAIALAQKGADVTVVEQAGRIASDAAFIHYLALLNEIERLENLKIVLNTVCTGVIPEGVQCKGADGAETVFAADRVVIAAGMLPLRNEAEAFLGAAPYVAIAGDCGRASQMSEAVLSGYFAGYYAR
jgi:pyruvate/2-oxoglutarate dehydrogenase complex dihydrolipoamide dehydrogenase (E3) component